MSKPRIAINGMGRIGRLVLKLLIENDAVEVVAINDLAPNESLLYLIKYDTVQKHQPKSIFCDGEYIVINGKRVHSTSIANPLELPWKEKQYRYCSGMYRYFSQKR
jgi:glyceraldehyde 3-phosphate dehydrogenase